MVSNQNEKVGMNEWLGARQYRVVQDSLGKKQWIPAGGMMVCPPRRKTRAPVGPIGRPRAPYTVGDTEWVGAGLYRVGQDAFGKKVWEPAMNAVCNGKMTIY